MERKPQPEPDRNSLASSEANQNLGPPLNEDEWAAIDVVLDRMHQEAADAKNGDAPPNQNQ